MTPANGHMDDRISDALRATAVEPAVDGVEAQVARRREHRRAMRRVQAGVTSALAVALVTVGAVVLVSDDTERRVAVAPAPGTYPVVRAAPGLPGAHAGTRATVRPVRVTPDEGYLRGPLLEGRGGLALAAYDRAGDSYTFPPSRVVRVSADGDVVDRVDLQGEILSLADGEGARWVLTKDKTVVGPADIEFRVKRIGADGTVASNEVPRAQQPTGTIVAGGGGVWVPTRTSVLRFDVTTGSLAATIPMAVTTDQRDVAAGGKAAYVTDGPGLLRLDPSSDQASPDVTVAEGGVAELVGVASDELVTWALGSGADGAPPSVTRWDLAQPDQATTVALPADFEPTELFAADGVAWVEGSLDGRHTVLVVGSTARGLEVVRTIRLTRADDESLVAVGPTELRLTSDGSLFRVRLPAEG